MGPLIAAGLPRRIRRLPRRLRQDALGRSRPHDHGRLHQPKQGPIPAPRARPLDHPAGGGAAAVLPGGAPLPARGRQVPLRRDDRGRPATRLRRPARPRARADAGSACAEGGRLRGPGRTGWFLGGALAEPPSQRPLRPRSADRHAACSPHIQAIGNVAASIVAGSSTSPPQRGRCPAGPGRLPVDTREVVDVVSWHVVAVCGDPGAASRRGCAPRPSCEQEDEDRTCIFYSSLTLIIHQLSSALERRKSCPD